MESTILEEHTIQEKQQVPKSNKAPEQASIRIVSASPLDMAFQPAYMKFTSIIAGFTIVPGILIFLLFDISVITSVMVALWLFACLTWLAGGTAKIAAIDLDTEIDPTAQNGIDLIKKRWASLCFGYIGFVVALFITFWITGLLLSKVSELSSVISALLIIPIFLFQLVAFAIVTNTYLYCAIVGYEDKNMLESVRILAGRCIKAPFSLINMSFDIFKTLFPTMISTGIILALCITSTLWIISPPSQGFMPNFNMFSMLSFDGLAGSIRLASLALIVFAWLAYLINVMTITYVIGYRENS